jgi:hypothetical protein
MESYGEPELEFKEEECLIEKRLVRNAPMVSIRFLMRVQNDAISCISSKFVNLCHNEHAVCNSDTTGFLKLGQTVKNKFCLVKFVGI